MELAAVGDAAVGRRQVEHVDADRAKRERRDRHLVLLARVPLEAEPLGEVDDHIGADQLLRLCDRDVERVLQRVAHPHRAALASIGVRHAVAVHDLALDVHEHGRRRDDSRLEAGGIGDRLEGRARLPVGLADDVEVGLVLWRRLAEEAGAADVGEHRAGPIVDGHDGVVVDVATLQLGDPAERLIAVLVRELLVRHAVHVVRDLRPLLRGRLVPLVVEGRDDPQPTGVEQLLAVEQLGRLPPHRVDEMRRPVCLVVGRGQQHLLGDRRVVLGLGDEVRLQHLVQNEVAHRDGLGGYRYGPARLPADVLLDRFRRGVQS